MHIAASVGLCILLAARSASALFTSSNGALQQDGQRFYLKGLSWFGFETSLNVFHGLWQEDYNVFFDVMANNSFNALRLPFNLDMVLNDPMPTSISYGYCDHNVSCNAGLKGLTSLQVLDVMVGAAGARGINILLDMHSFEPDAYEENGLWYDATHPEALVLQGWDALIARYGSAPNILGVDLKNEPFQGTWNAGVAATDWNSAAERIGNHIAAATDWLIFVEGTASSPACSPGCFYGEDLVGVATAPVALNVSGRLVYSPHVYGPSVFEQPYFSDPTFPANMPAIWDAHFGYIRAQAGPAVVVGEWGGQTSGTDMVWLNAFVAYLKSRDMTDTFFWCLNNDSGDTGGIMNSDWYTTDPVRLALLAQLVPNPGLQNGAR